MALVTELVTKLTVDGKNFTSEIHKAAQEAEGFTNKLIKGFSIAAAAGSVLVTGIFAELNRTILDTAEVLDKMVNTATKLNIAVGSFQALSYAAKIANVDQGALEQGLKKMTLNIQKAVENADDLKEPFGKLNITLAQLKGLAPDQQYLLIAKAISSIADPAEQARRAFEVFGRNGQEQLNLLRSDVNKSVQDFYDLGGAITDVQAKSVDKFGDTRDKLGAIWEAFKTQLTVAAIPAFQLLYDYIIKVIDKFGGLKGAAQAAAGFVISGISLIVEALAMFIDGIAAVQTAFLKLEQVALRTFLAIKQVASPIDTLTYNESSDVAQLKDVIRQGDNRINKLQTGSLSKAGSSLHSLSDSISNVQQSVKVDVNVKADNGLKVEVAESPEVTRQVNKLIASFTAQEARGVAN